MTCAARRQENGKHASRVYCTACHITSFARHDKTDMHRDWSQTEAVTGEGRFEPKIEFQSNVKPVYAWWNGTGETAFLNEAVKVRPNGKVAMYAPNGSKKDSKARIYAFKYHTAKKALGCNDRHEGGTRMDWKALGYAGDPAKGKIKATKVAAR